MRCIESKYWKKYPMRMKALNIFLLTLIIIGVFLLVTQKTWVPKLVDYILNQEALTAEEVKQTEKVGSDLSYSTSTVAQESISNPKVKERIVVTAGLYAYVARKDGVYRMRESDRSEETRIVSADPETIEPVAAPSIYGFTYLKDKSGVFVDGVRIEDADPQSFTILTDGGYYAKDKNYVFIYTDYRQPAKIVAGADPNTFAVLKEPGVNPCGSTPFYGVDKNNVFYKNRMIPGADIASFELLNMGYAKDKYHVYKGGELVAGADPASFQPPVCNPGY